MGEHLQREPEEKEYNIRIYIPVDLNRESIMRRLADVISMYEEASEENEIGFRQMISLCE